MPDIDAFIREFAESDKADGIEQAAIMSMDRLFEDLPQEEALDASVAILDKAYKDYVLLAIREYHKAFHEHS